MKSSCTLISYNLDRLLKTMLVDFKNCIRTIDDESFNYIWKLGIFNISSLSRGGFGLVYDIKHRNLSITTITGQEIVAKCNKNRLNLEIVEMNNDIFAVDYDVSEIYFAALLSYIYRLKICPFICKYLSVNMIDEEYILFIQKYETELLVFPHLSADYVINFLFQLTYTMYILKMYLGLVHFDVHLRNVMVTKSNRSFMIMNRKEGIYLPEMNFEIRLIDFGFCLADLSNSVDPFLKNSLKFAPINFKKQQNKLPNLFFSNGRNGSKLLTIELQYFMLHIYQLTKRSQSESHPICLTIQNFAECMYQKKVDFNKPSLGDKNVILSEHDVGVECDINNPTMLMKGLLRYCEKYGSIHEEKDFKRFCPFKKYQYTSNTNFLYSQPNKDVLYKYKMFAKQDIPLVPWFEDTFYNLGSNFGQRIVFSINHSSKIEKEKQETCLHVLLENVPFSNSNAYITFENQKIIFYKKRNLEIYQKNMYFCGQFLHLGNQGFKFVNKPKLLLGLNDNNFFIFYFKFSLSAKHVIQIINQNNLTVLIDATSSMGFTYKGDDITSISKTALFYISL